MLDSPSSMNTIVLRSISFSGHLSKQHFGRHNPDHCVCTTRMSTFVPLTSGAHVPQRTSTQLSMGTSTCSHPRNPLLSFASFNYAERGCRPRRVFHWSWGVRRPTGCSSRRLAVLPLSSWWSAWEPVRGVTLDG